MLAEPFIWELFEYFPCRAACHLRPVPRDDDRVVLEIGSIADSGDRHSIAATIWAEREGGVHVILGEKGGRRHDWPDLEINRIAGKICAFCGRKTSQVLASPCRYRMLH